MPTFDSEYVYYLQERIRQLEQKMFKSGTKNPFRPDLDKKMSKPKRKLSAWNKYVKANSKKPRFRLRSGSPNLKKLGVAFRKTPAGKKKRR